MEIFLRGSRPAFVSSMFILSVATVCINPESRFEKYEDFEAIDNDSIYQELLHSVSVDSLTDVLILRDSIESFEQMANSEIKFLDSIYSLNTVFLLKKRALSRHQVEVGFNSQVNKRYQKIQLLFVNVSGYGKLDENDTLPILSSSILLQKLLLQEAIADFRRRERNLLLQLIQKADPVDG